MDKKTRTTHIINAGARRVEVTVAPGQRKGRHVLIVRPVRDAGAATTFIFATISGKIREDWKLKGFCVMSPECFNECKVNEAGQ